MKKVLYVHHSGYMGGAPRSLTYLISHLDKQKFQGNVLTIRNGPAVKLLESGGLPVEVAKGMFPFHGSTVSGMTPKLFIRNLIGALPTYFQAKKYIRKYQPDIIHLNSTCLFQVARAAKKVSPDTKVVCHVREPLLNSFAGNILKRMNHKYVDGYISIDQFDSETVDSAGRELEVVYNFVDFKSYNPDVSGAGVRRELGLADDDIVFLYIGRVVSGNGVLDMVNAFNKISKDHPKFKLVVGGFYFNKNNAYEDKVMEACKGNDQIYPLAFRDDVPQMIAASNVMMCPFVEPHFSRSIIEAASMKKPAIGTNIGGPNELILHGKTGYLFESGDYNEMAQYMIKIGTDPALYEKLGQSALSFAEENFDARKNAKRTFDFYNRFFVREPV
ncbi:glycosyltransferase family 4 protein [Paenibacillus sp. Z6-24]